MALSRATVGGKITAALFNALTDYAEGNVPGLKPVIPTSVAGAGVSYSSTTGLVTVTAASTASLNGIFTSSFRNYLVQVDITAASNSCGIRLRASGADDSSANYDRQTDQGTAAAASAASSTGQTSWGAMAILSTTHTEGSSEFTFYAPQVASKTRLVGKVFSADATTAVAVASIGGRHRSASSFDGLTLIPAVGTITATVKVYGFN